MKPNDYVLLDAPGRPTTLCVARGRDKTNGLWRLELISELVKKRRFTKIDKKEGGIYLAHRKDVTELGISKPSQEDANG